MIRTTVEEMARKGIIEQRLVDGGLYYVNNGWLVLYKDEVVRVIDANARDGFIVNDVLEVSIYRELTGESMI